MVSSYGHFDGATHCSENKAKRGGGGCLFWNPEAQNIYDNKWNKYKPKIVNEKFLRNNVALFGSSLATPGVSFRISNFISL